MNKKTFLQIVREAQESGTATFANLFPVLWAVVRYITEDYDIFDRDMAADKAIEKTYRKTGDYIDRDPEELFGGICYFAHCCANNQYRERKKIKKYVEDFVFTSQEERDRCIENETANRSRDMTERLIQREEIYEYFATAMRANDLYLFVAAFQIKKSDFEGKAVISGKEIFDKVYDKAYESFSPSDLKRIKEFLCSIPTIDVNKLYFKLYNERKKFKQAACKQAQEDGGVEI